MGEQHFEVIFRGDVELGRSVVEVKEGLAKLFNADVSRIEQMFSGKPVVIKANLDENTAFHYQASLKAVGALVDIRSSESIDAFSKLPDQTAVVHVSSEQANAPTDTEKMVDFDFDVAPIGADMLPTEHKKDYTPADVDTSHLSVSDIGSDVLDEKDKRSYEESDVDISHLSITAIGNVE